MTGPVVQRGKRLAVVRIPGDANDQGLGVLPLAGPEDGGAAEGGKEDVEEDGVEVVTVLARNFGNSAEATL